MNFIVFFKKFIQEILNIVYGSSYCWEKEMY